MGSVRMMLCNPLYKVCCHRKLENTSHGVSGRNDMDHFNNIANTMIRPGDHGHVLFSALPFKA